MQILGCSADPPKKQKKFCEKKNFPYFLLSDESHETLKDYGGGERNLWVENIWEFQG